MNDTTIYEVTLHASAARKTRTYTFVQRPTRDEIIETLHHEAENCRLVVQDEDDFDSERRDEEIALIDLMIQVVSFAGQSFPDDGECNHCISVAGVQVGRIKVEGKPARTR